MSRALRVMFAGFCLAACGGVAATGGGDDDAGTDGSIAPDSGTPADARVTADAADAGVDTATSDAAADTAIVDAAIDNDPRCPASYGATGACTAEGLTCRYAEGRCDCARPCSGVFIPDASWTCIQAEPGCPSDPPPVGASCASQGAHCVYPGCCTRNDFTCAGGAWDAAAPFCPP